MTDGIVVSADARAAWAWVAVRVDAAADLTELHEYSALPERERFTKAVAAETAWLAGQWDPAGGSRIEVRYRTDPTHRRLFCAVLGRVQAPTTALAIASAQTLRDRLAAAPRHALVSVVRDTLEVARWLEPFRAHSSGLVELRKRFRVGTPNRPDAGVRYYLAVQPFTTSARSWEPLFQAMLAHPHPLLLSVGLEPYVVPPEVTRALHQLATHYGRLAAPGHLPDGPWTSGRQLAPDAFAVEATRAFGDAARRYDSRAFRLRISLASPAPLPESLPELAAAVISPPERPGDASPVAGTFHGSAHVAVRPVQAEVDQAWRNLTTLDQARWDAQYLRDLPDPPPPVLRLLAELADPREASAAARLPLAVHGHLPGFPVRQPGVAGEVDQVSAGDHVELGRQLVSGRPAGPIGVPVAELTRHALFVGTTGSGKTNSSLGFCRQLWRDHGVPFLVIEPVNSDQDDYRWLATQPGFDELLVLTVGDETVAPYRLNPFEVPQGVRISNHLAGLLACFDAAFGLWDPLPDIYKRALRATYARRGVVPTDVAGPHHVDRWPMLGDFTDAIAKETEKLGYAGDIRANLIAASLLRAESLAEGACASSIDCARSYPIEVLLSRPVVIELAGVAENPKEQALMMALILQTMTEHYKARRPPGGALAHVTVIEEAHRLLGRPSPHSGQVGEGDARARAAQTFANTLAENRKYGEGLVIVEQVPGKLIEDAYKNTNLKVMHRLPAEDDRRLIGSTMRLTADQERHASTLKPFTAFAYHDGIDRAALVQAPNVRADAAAAAGIPSAPLADAAELAERFRSFANSDDRIDAALGPFPECDGCLHRCAFRFRAATAVRPEDRAQLTSRAAHYPHTVETQRAWWGETIPLGAGTRRRASAGGPPPTPSAPTTRPASSSTSAAAPGGGAHSPGCNSSANTPLTRSLLSETRDRPPEAPPPDGAGYEGPEESAPVPRPPDDLPTGSPAPEAATKSDAAPSDASQTDVTPSAASPSADLRETSALETPRAQRSAFEPPAPEAPEPTRPDPEDPGRDRQRAATDSAPARGGTDPARAEAPPAVEPGPSDQALHPQRDEAPDASPRVDTDEQTAPLPREPYDIDRHNDRTPADGGDADSGGAHDDGGGDDRGAHGHGGDRDRAEPERGLEPTDGDSDRAPLPHDPVDGSVNRTVHEPTGEPIGGERSKQNVDGSDLAAGHSGSQDLADTSRTADARHGPERVPDAAEAPPGAEPVDDAKQTLRLSSTDLDHRPALRDPPANSLIEVDGGSGTRRTTPVEWSRRRRRWTSSIATTRGPAGRTHACGQAAGRPRGTPVRPHLPGTRGPDQPDTDGRRARQSGQYKTLENRWRGEIESGGTVQVEIDLRYGERRDRPDTIVVFYRLTSGEQRKVRIPQTAAGWKARIMTLETHPELLTKIGQAWRNRHRRAGSGSRCAPRVSLDDGDRLDGHPGRRRDRPDRVHRRRGRRGLRGPAGGSYQPGKGTWYTATFTSTATVDSTPTSTTTTRRRRKRGSGAAPRRPGGLSSRPGAVAGMAPGQHRGDDPRTVSWITVSGSWSRCPDRLQPVREALGLFFALMTYFANLWPDWATSSASSPPPASCWPPTSRRSPSCRCCSWCRSRSWSPSASCWTPRRPADLARSPGDVRRTE
jgi:hypothetical protein